MFCPSIISTKASRSSEMTTLCRLPGILESSCSPQTYGAPWLEEPAKELSAYGFKGQEFPFLTRCPDGTVKNDLLAEIPD